VSQFPGSLDDIGMRPVEKDRSKPKKATFAEDILPSKNRI